MYRTILMIIGGSIVFIAAIASADTLVLKDGRTLTGVYMSGTASAIEFEVDGTTHTYPLESIISLMFQRSAAPVSTPKSGSSPTTATQKSFTIDAGTQLMVRTESDLITGKVKPGDRFTALLEADLVVGNITVAHGGSAIYGRVVEAKKAKRIRGVAKLVIELTDLMIDGQLYPLVTDQIGYQGEKSGTLKKIALGALTGSAIDGSDGAKTGAKIGAGVAVLTKGKQISIPAKSLIAFRMTKALQIGR